jgi:alpha-tubulin suppressor-like RCC1 family protein
VSGGAVHCWGEGGWAPDAKSTFANPGISGATAISSGDSFACALSVDGIVSCFGRNEQGELGANPDEDNHVKPLAVRDVNGATAIGSAESHSCAILKGGSVSCWGSNTEGELGRGTTTTQELAATVGGIANVVSVVPGADHVCARTADASVYCWGNNRYGQIGDGSKDPRLTPAKISF